MSSQKELISMRPGDVLRYQRELKGLTLERAAAESRIKPTVLEAIEAGETDHIPSVYLKGHIRNYARFLGVDPSDIEEQIHEVSGADPEVRSVFGSNPARNRTERWLKISGYLAASVMIATLAWQFTSEAVRFSQGETHLNPTASVDEEPGASTEDVTEPGARNGRTHLNASIASVEVLKKRAEAVGNHAAEDAWAAIDNPVVEAGQHLLKLTTSADTWVEIYGANEELIEMDLVRAGESREYRDDGPFRLMIGRASAVVLSLDGKAVDLGPHTRGNVANLTLAEELHAEVEVEASPTQ